METQIVNATEYRNVSLALLSESKTNPRRTFGGTALKELAESIRTQGVLSPLLVRPLTENGFEIIAGARRYRAAQMAEAPRCARPHCSSLRCGGVGGSIGGEPYQVGNSPDGRSAGIPRFAGLGRAEVQHRADRGEGGQIARLRGFEEIGRAHV